jgi:hypothetical protein
MCRESAVILGRRLGAKFVRLLRLGRLFLAFFAFFFRFFRRFVGFELIQFRRWPVRHAIGRRLERRQFLAFSRNALFEWWRQQQLVRFGCRLTRKWSVRNSR